MPEQTRDYDPTKSQSIFPVNAPITVEDLGREDVDQARSRLYTAWWMHCLSSDPDYVYPEDNRPLYQIVCETEAEARVAWAVKPPFVNVILRMGDVRLELPESGKQIGEA
ncbi:MAG: hypothetical protein ACHQT9_02705 [Candidatus Saccharimonadales bacterium]